MARVAGVDIPDNKRVEVALRYVYGIGPVNAKQIVDQAGVMDNPKVRELSTEPECDGQAGAGRNIVANVLRDLARGAQARQHVDEAQHARLQGRVAEAPRQHLRGPPVQHRQMRVLLPHRGVERAPQLLRARLHRALIQ